MRNYWLEIACPECGPGKDELNQSRILNESGDAELCRNCGREIPGTRVEKEE